MAHYIGYDIEYDETKKTVNYYKTGKEKPVIKREYSIFPIDVQELNFEGNKEIVKIYELSGNENPSEISKEPFEKNGYIYSLSDITKSGSEGIDTKEHSETVTLNTASQDTNTILTTTAVYSGEVSKIVEGKTIYTAYFTGKAIEKEPEPKELTKEELEQKLKELKDKNKNSIDFNFLWLLIPLLSLLAVGTVLYLFIFKGNVKVFSRFEKDFKRIGRTKVTKQSPIIDLTSFTSKVTNPNFIIVLNRFTAKILDGKMATINYGDSSFQHIVAFSDYDSGSKEDKKKGYQIQIDF